MGQVVHVTCTHALNMCFTAILQQAQATSMMTAQYTPLWRDSTRVQVIRLLLLLPFCLCNCRDT
jgi:hypothetical protein